MRWNHWKLHFIYQKKHIWRDYLKKRIAIAKYCSKLRWKMNIKRWEEEKKRLRRGKEEKKWIERF